MTTTEKQLIEAGKKALIIKETDKRYYKALLEFANAQGWVRYDEYQKIKSEVIIELDLE